MQRKPASAVGSAEEQHAQGRFAARGGQAIDGKTACLRTVVRCAIITVIAHLSLAQFAPPETLL